MAVYGAHARMLNDLYFLNLDKPTAELHKSLACSRCRRVFRKPFGLERHFRELHAGVGLEEAAELLESLEQRGKAAKSEDGGSKRQEQQQDAEESPLDCDEDSSDDDEPIISSEEEDAADDAATPSPPETPAPSVEVIHLSSDEDEDDDEDSAFIDSNDTSSVVDSEADTIVEGGGDDTTDSGFESNKVSPRVGGTPEEERSASIRSWVASGGVKEEEGSAGWQLPFCDPHEYLPEKKNSVAEKSKKDRLEPLGMGAILEDEDEKSIAATERTERVKKIENVATQMSDKKVSGPNNKEWTSEKDMTGGRRSNKSKKKDLNNSATKEGEAVIGAGENGQVVKKDTNLSLKKGQKKESSHSEAEKCLSLQGQMPQEGDKRKRKMQSCDKAEDVADHSSQDEDSPRTKAKKMSIDKKKPKEQHTKDMSKKVERLSVPEEKDSGRQMEEVQRSEPAQKNHKNPELGRNRFPFVPLNRDKKTDPMMRLREGQKNKLARYPDILQESKIVDPGHYNGSNQGERLGTRDVTTCQEELASPKKWMNSYKIPKVKPREGDNRSPPSSSDGEKENASPAPNFGSDKYGWLPKATGDVKNRGILKVRGYPQKPKTSYEREVKWPGRNVDSRHKKKKQLRWREPLVKVFRFYSDRDRSDEGNEFTQETRREEKHIVEEVSGANAERIKIVERHVVSEYSREANKNDTVKWEERIIKEIKTVLNPFYSREKISTSTYREIVRKCVPKIPKSSDGVINTVKVKRLVDAYVDRYTYEERKQRDKWRTRTWGF